MKKKVLSLAVAAVMAPGFAAAADTSGFADINYVASNDNKTGVGMFGANGEVDFSASPADGVTTRVDLNLNLATNGTIGENNSQKQLGSMDSGSIEQAFFAWGVTEGITVIGGVFNDPIGLEAEDVTDRTFMNHGVVYNILDHQTVLAGDNIAGLAVAGAVGPVTLTGAVLDDLYLTDRRNSGAFLANYSPIKGLDLELGFVSQAGQNTSAHGALSAGDVTNFNVSYSPEQLKGLNVSLDYLAGSQIVDSAYEIYTSYTMDNGLGVGVRGETVSWSGNAPDSSRTTVNVSYQVASNLKAILETATGNTTMANAMTAVTGIMPKNYTTLNLVAKF